MDTEKKLKEAFKKAKYEENPNLSLDVWNNIILHNKRIIRFKLWAFSLVGSFSFLALIPAWNALSLRLTQSGFYEYTSLLFSSNNSIATYWKELAFSITESLPIINIALSLSLIFVLLMSIKYIVRQIIKGQSYPAGYLTLSF